MNKIEQILVLLLFLPVLHAKSQTDTYALTPEKLLPQFSTLTPEAASLGKYGSYNVSEYSGSPNIKIPLFTISSANVSIPVELYYDASGIKVNQDATFVGLGWNLSYGGCINHIVCGYDDFREYPNNAPSYFHDYYPNHSIPDDVPCQYYYQYNDHMSLVGYSGSGLTLCLPVPDSRPFLFHYDMSRGFHTPDVFQASFCGHHLSFIIDKREDSKIIIINDDGRKYKIEYEMGNIYPSSFRITDDKGVTYQFQAYKEFDKEDSYYLSHVYGADGVTGKDAISFEYKTGFFNPGNSRPDIKTINSIGKYLGGDYPNDDALTTIMGSLIGPNNHYANLTGENGYYNKVYPYRITTPLETIEFGRQEREDLSGAYAINNITVKSKNDEILHQVNLTYDYFHEQSSSSFYTNKRLKLTTVSVNSKKYQLSYDTSPLPAFMSTSQDYWGYYNGEDNGNDLCGTPRYKIQGNTAETIEYLGNANRYASQTLGKVGMLKRITYPTGGYTDFEYETNHFNDAYYYPDACSGFISTPNIVYDWNVNLVGAYYGPREASKTFSLQDMRKFSLHIELSSTNQSDDVASVVLKNADTGQTVKSVTVSNGNVFGGTYSVTLSPGNYLLEAKITVNGNGNYTAAVCKLSHEETKFQVSDIQSEQNKGGASVGGGLRIKSIKNYDSSSAGENKYMNGVEYEYRDGKLLIPTLRLEKHLINFSYLADNGYGAMQFPNFTFAYACSEPTYQGVCSIDVPATVGYSTVIKKEVDENGQVLRKTVLDFHNYGYEINEQINQRVGNAFYYSTNGHLNGKLKDETIYSGNETSQYHAHYTYGSTRVESVLYPKCIATFLPDLFLDEVNFHLAFFRKNVYWDYLTSKSETFYNSSGNVTNSNTTTYTYNESNYQPATKTVNNGLQSEKTRYWYPTDADNPSSGLSILTNKNYLSEVTGIDIYRNNTYTTGSRYHYALSNSMPVVSRCLSIFPDGSTAVEMDVNSYDGYDSSGNIQQYQKKDGTPVTIIWSYKYQLPIMEIVGKTYSQVLSAASNVSQLGSMLSPSYSTIKAVYNNIKQTWPDAHVTAYLYSPWHTVSRVIMPNGQEMTYDYDGEGRLVRAGDLMGTLQEYQYKYKVQ